MLSLLVTQHQMKKVQFHLASEPRQQLGLTLLDRLVILVKSYNMAIYLSLILYWAKLES